MYLLSYRVTSQSSDRYVNGIILRVSKVKIVNIKLRSSGLWCRVVRTSTRIFTAVKTWNLA